MNFKESKKKIQAFTKMIGMLSLISLTACLSGEEDSGSNTGKTSTSQSLSGNVIVSTTTTDAVIMFDSSGNFLDLVYSPQSGAGQINGLSWNSNTEEVMISLDAADHIIAVNPLTKVKRTAFIHGQLNGAIRGLVQLPVSQNFLVVESNCLERFDSSGNRIAGIWPFCAGLSVPQQLSPLASGGFVMCSTGTDDLRVYDEDANLTKSVVVGSDPYGCTELSDGRFAIASRLNDEVRIYSSDLLTLDLTFDNTTYITDSRGIAEASNGNILVTDVAYDYVAEIDTSGNFVKSFGGWILNDPYDIIVIQ